MQQGLSSEGEAVLGVLDDLSSRFDSAAFELVRQPITRKVFARSSELTAAVQNGISPRQCAYTEIANITGDLLESGRHHLYRGVLDPLGPGDNLLRLFDFAVDGLVKLGAFDAAYAEKQKSAIRDGIRTVG